MIVDCAVYLDGVRVAGNLPLEAAYSACHEDEAFVWLGLFEPDEAEFESVRREFHLHELAIEDAVTAHQRPKLEAYGETLFMVIKTAAYNDAEEEVAFGEVQLFIGPTFLITVRHGSTALHDVRLSLEARPDLMRFGTSAALHAIVDRVVDDYDPVIAGLDHDIREVEEEVFSDSNTNPAERIYYLKREVLALHEAMGGLPDAVDRLAGRRHRVIHDEMAPYFRDVHDHLLRVVNQVESFRDLLTSVLTANLTQVSIRQNEDTRHISAWAAIIAVPTMIAGIYGMNFDNMPELSWSLGYPVVIASLFVVSVALYVNFKRTGWL